MGIVQNVTLSLPIIARVPPPEGQTGANVNFTLDGGNVATYNLFQLNSQNGLVMSQVCSLCVDNTKNGGTLTVTHGAFNEVVLIPPYTFQIFPTFSTQGQYPLSINGLNACTVPVILLNYVRPPAQFPTTHQTSIFNTGYNVWSYYSNVIKITGNGLTELGLSGNMWIDSLDLAIDTVNTAADAQDCAMAFTINDPESISWNILSGQVGLYVATHGQNIGGSFYPPMYRTWPQGYMCGGIPTLGVSGFTGFAAVYMRINFSAYQPP